MSNLLVIIRPSLRWDVLWYTNVRPSVCPSVRFTCRALTQEPLGQFTSNFTVIGIGVTVCILYSEILNFHSRVMGLYS